MISVGTLRRFKEVRGQQSVKCGPKGRQWTPRTQRLPNWCHTLCLTDISKIRGFQWAPSGGLGGSGGNQVSNVVLRGANELPWPRDFQIGVTLDDFQIFFFFYFFKNNNEKCELKIPASEVKLCNYPMIPMAISVFKLPNYFGSFWKKYTFCVFFQKWTKKNWRLKN